MKKNIGYFFNFLMMGVSLFFVTEAALAQNSVIPANGLTKEYFREKAFSEITAKAEENGEVRVIIGLNVETKPEGELSLSGLNQQRSLIKNAQNNLLRKLGKTDSASVIQYKFIPYLAFVTNATELKKMKADENIVSLEEDMMMKPAMEQSLPIVGAPLAWNAGFSGNGKTIAVLDSGTDKAHPFFAGKIVSEACYSSNFPASNATSLCPGGVLESTAVNSGVHCDSAINGCPHGTHVAGIAVGKDAAIGKYGVARDASLISIQVTSRIISTSFCGNATPCVIYYYSNAVQGLERVLALNGTFDITSVNMSFGGGNNTTTCDTANPAMKAAIDNLRSVGIASTISAMNNSYTNALGFPACISSAISVGSTDDGSSGTILDNVSSFSNSSSFLTILAPGRWINSSLPNNSYGNYQGTSMAAPHVAGAWAILKQRVPNASVDRVLQTLVNTGTPITDSRNGIVKPRINIFSALQAINPQPRTFDFDGDSKSDVSVFRPSNSIWYASKSSDNGVLTTQWGIASDKITPADYNGDGKTDYAVFRAGFWYVLLNGGGFEGYQWGSAGDIPFPADFDADGKADLAVFRNGTWFVRKSSGGTITQNWGSVGDIPVIADYDADGKSDFAVYRNGIWYVLKSTGGDTAVQWGIAGDKTVQADYNGDGKADYAVFRNGFWYILLNGGGFIGAQWGTTGDLASPADYDGDGRTDLAVFRNGVWYIQRTTAGVQVVNFGSAGDKPVANAFVP